MGNHDPYSTNTLDRAGEDKVLGAIDEISAGEFKESSALVLL
jgi:hypothetical protein